ncbi:MAG: glycosyltransferase [Patescibacteria group bacterium]|jgi:glycosyltransferase involved in cell wall biosynthesis
MKVLVLSVNHDLLKKGETIEAVLRHKLLGDQVERLDVIIPAKSGEINQVSDKVKVYPTNSRSKFSYLSDCYRLGKKLFLENNYQLILTPAPFIISPVGWWLAKKFKAKFLLHFHGNYLINQNWLKENWFNRLLILESLRLAKKANGIQVMAEEIKQFLIKKNIAEGKIRVITSVIAKNKFGVNQGKNISPKAESQDYINEVIKFWSELINI